MAKSFCVYTRGNDVPIRSVRIYFGSDDSEKDIDVSLDFEDDDEDEDWMPKLEGPCPDIECFPGINPELDPRGKDILDFPTVNPAAIKGISQSGALVREARELGKAPEKVTVS